MRKKVVFVGNIGLVINSFIKDYIIALSSEYDVYVVYDKDTAPSNLIFPDTVTVVHYNVKRKFGAADLFFFFFLYRFLQLKKVYATISITPKVGVITNLAGFFARTPIRIHLFTGQIWINLKGVKRSIFKSIDKLLFKLTTHRFIDSSSQYAFLESQKFPMNPHSYVIHQGSICGVDINRFRRDQAARNEIRGKYNIDNLIVLLYIGRLDVDKGIMELLDAFEKINRKDICLLLVGPDEMDIQKVLARYTIANRVIYEKMTAYPERYYSAGDIFCYVSHREGFGVSAIEASSCLLPIIGTDIVGLRDAVKNEHTGILITPGNNNELVVALNRLIDNSVLREVMGSNGRMYVNTLFRKELIQDGYIKMFRKIIA